jgi:hypothetical protein
MQPPEHLEDPLRLRRIHADPVVPHPEPVSARLALCSDVDPKGPIGAELERVREQVLKDVRELARVRLHGGQRIDGDLGLLLGDRLG